MGVFGHLNKVLEFSSTSEVEFYWFAEDGAVTMVRQPNISAVKIEKFRLFAERYPDFSTRRLQQIITNKVDQSQHLVVEMANSTDEERIRQINIEIETLIGDEIAHEVHEAELEISKQRIARVTENRKFERVMSDDELRQLGRLANNTVTKSQPRSARSFLRPLAQ